MALTTTHALALVLSTIAALTSASPAPQAAASSSSTSSTSTSSSSTTSSSASGSSIALSSFSSSPSSFSIPLNFSSSSSSSFTTPAAAASTSITSSATTTLPIVAAPPSSPSISPNSSSAFSPDVLVPNTIALIILLPNTTIDGHLFLANNSRFLISDDYTYPPSTYCPPSISNSSSSFSSSGSASSFSSATNNCPPVTNLTTFNVSPAGASNAFTLSLAVEVPGGQSVYFDSNDAFSFAPPFVGNPAQANGTISTAQFVSADDGQVTPQGRSWCVAPIDTPGFVQVYAPMTGSQKQGCVPVEVQSLVWAGGVGAWQYQ